MTMNDLDIKILGSSSKGNCYVIDTHEGILLLECGLKYKEILKAIDFKIQNVLGCIVTHEHKDHSKSIKELTDAGVDVYASAGTLEACNIQHHRAIPVKSENQFQTGKFKIMPFETQHDAKEPLGYLIFHPDFGRLLFATDTYYVKYKFKNLNYIMVECNFSLSILNERVKSGDVHEAMKKRLLGSHFSLENVVEFLTANNLSTVKQIYLIHLSDGNSDEKVFKETIQRTTGKPVIVC